MRIMHGKQFVLFGKFATRKQAERRKAKLKHAFWYVRIVVPPDGWYRVYASGPKTIEDKRNGHT
jgi:cell division protein FtsN